MRKYAAAVVLVWLVIAAVGGPLLGRLSEVQTNDNAAFLPASAESTAVNQFVAKLTDTSTLPYLVVIEREGGLTDADRAAVASYVAAVPDLPLASDPSRKVGEFLSAPPAAIIPSEDGKALLVPVSVVADKADDVVGSKTVLFEVAGALRAGAATSLAPAGLTAHVTGPGGFLADLITAFGGIDGILLVVALGVVFVILLIVYRSPILPFAVLVSAVFGLSAAALVVYPLAKSGTISLSGQSQGILSILVVGAATDYALLLVSRYKEALHQYESPWQAMKVAWRGAVEPITASAATVILGLLCLLLSDLGNTRGLGPVGALGILGALAASLTFLPAVLVLVGRRAFWPQAPRVDHVAAGLGPTEDTQDTVGASLDAQLRGLGVWGRVAALVGRKPRRVWGWTLVALLALAAFAPTFQARGVTQADLFLTTVDSVTGQEVLARHFPAGSGSPLQVVVPEAQADHVVQVLGTINGLRDPFVGQTQGQKPTVIDGKVLVQATLTDPADSVAAEDTVEVVRRAVESVGPDVLVGGTAAVNYDVRQATERDLKVIIPTILAVIFVVLALLLRAIVAPLVLVAANVLSFAATIGVAALMFNHVFTFPGSDPATPLLAFVFLVALGIDYSIFLMTRVREEARHRGTRKGILVALAVTGGVITSAGIVLAATFSALAIIPILFLAQIAFIVAFGVLLDTLVVRSLLVPAVSYDLGRRIWWPFRLKAAGAHEAGQPVELTSTDSS